MSELVSIEPKAEVPVQICAVFRLSAPINLPGAPFTPLLIDDKEPKFFKEALRQGCRFSQCALGGGVLWRLEFFQGSRFAVTYLAYSRARNVSEVFINATSLLFNELIAHLGLKPDAGVLIDSARLIWLDQDFDEAARLASSQYLRGTNSLGEADFDERSARRFAIDSRGLALVARGKMVAPIFQRYILLMALLRAYQYAIDSAVDHLAQLTAAPAGQGSDANQLSGLRRDTLVFTARFLFARPVSLETVDLRHIWERLAQANHLSETHAELNEQLTAVHALLLHDEELRENAREKRSQLGFTLIGLLLAVLSLLGLVEITPETFQKFWRAWF
jgi:hypothetical protein